MIKKLFSESKFSIGIIVVSVVLEFCFAIAIILNHEIAQYLIYGAMIPLGLINLISIGCFSYIIYIDRKKYDIGEIFIVLLGHIFLALCFAQIIINYIQPFEGEYTSNITSLTSAALWMMLLIIGIMGIYSFVCFYKSLNIEKSNIKISVLIDDDDKKDRLKKQALRMDKKRGK